jgi:hypothetical protein
LKAPTLFVSLVGAAEADDDFTPIKIIKAAMNSVEIISDFLRNMKFPPLHFVLMMKQTNAVIQLCSLIPLSANRASAK